MTTKPQNPRVTLELDPDNDQAVVVEVGDRVLLFTFEDWPDLSVSDTAIEIWDEAEAPEGAVPLEGWERCLALEVEIGDDLLDRVRDELEEILAQLREAV